MTNEEYINQHPEQFKDDIDKWLFTEFGIIGGCCSSQGSLEYSVARKVVERWKNKEEPESKDLEDEIDIYTEYLDPKDIKNAPFAHIEECARHFAKWQKEHFLKDAQGDDFPEIDREVIALIEAFGHYKVIFAHRVDENAEIHTSIEGKPCVLHPIRYDKGGWNTSNIKWWLDIELPKIEE